MHLCGSVHVGAGVHLHADVRLGAGAGSRWLVLALGD